MTAETFDHLVEKFNDALCAGTKQFRCEPHDRERYEMIRQYFNQPSTPPDADWDVQWVDGFILFFKMKGRP